MGTVDAIQRELVRDGFVMRYIPDKDAADGLPPGEGAFLACSFWLVIDLAMLGRVDEARALFDRLLALRNDLGLFAEEYDQANQRLIGNFPQAFTHLTLIASAVALTQAGARAGLPPETDERGWLDSPPSGEQHEIRHGAHRAIVTEVGATLRHYSLDDMDIIDGFGVNEWAPSGRGQVLAPWPNRLDSGKYRFEGRDAQAALDEPELQNAIHGLVRWLPWELRRSRPMELSCPACFTPSRGTHGSSTCRSDIGSTRVASRFPCARGTCRPLPRLSGSGSTRT